MDIKGSFISMNRWRAERFGIEHLLAVPLVAMSGSLTALTWHWLGIWPLLFGFRLLDDLWSRSEDRKGGRDLFDESRIGTWFLGAVVSVAAGAAFTLLPWLIAILLIGLYVLSRVAPPPLIRVLLTHLKYPCLVLACGGGVLPALLFWMGFVRFECWDSGLSGQGLLRVLICWPALAFPWGIWATPLLWLVGWTSRMGIFVQTATAMGLAGEIQ